MANRQTSKELSTKYRAIDQKQLSDQAKETLKKLRLATKNFIGNDEEANDAFRTFYNNLLEKKPLAVKTSKEYKEMIRAKRRENGSKNFKRTPKATGTSTTTKKTKKEAPKGSGTDEDAHRPAKPFGWRLRGRKNYRKPTLSEIRSGKAYYEARVNRADVKRKKYPMLERGGYMAKGGEIHVVLNEGNGKIINKLYNDWNNVKTEKEYKKWVDEVRSTKFGTYGTTTYEEVLEKFNFDDAPINSYHRKAFKSELKNALEKGDEYSNGGKIFYKETHKND